MEIKHVKYNKEDIAKTMSRIGDIPESHAGKQLDLVLSAIIQTLAQAKDAEPTKKRIRAKLTMVGFGSFELKHNPERMHRNPQTQMPAPKKAHNTIKFIGGKMFTELINEPTE